MHKQISLQLGVYRNGSQAPRTLVKIAHGRCIYSFDDIETLLNRSGSSAQCEQTGKIKPRATTCSRRTFLNVMGPHPVREFTSAESEFLAKRMISLRPYRKCNRIERKIFFPEGSKNKIRDQTRSKDTESKHSNKPQRMNIKEWIYRLFFAARALLGVVRDRVLRIQQTRRR